jgi:hypothetical protein
LNSLYESDIGLSPPYPLDGQSLLDLWRVGSEPWRQNFLLEHWGSIYTGHRYTDTTIVTESWSYTETKGDKPELYDRANDPYELNNLWCSRDDPTCLYSETITNLAAELCLHDIAKLISSVDSQHYKMYNIYSFYNSYFPRDVIYC